MAVKATPVAADQAGQPGVTETKTNVPGVGEVSVYIKVERVDDVTATVTEDVQTLRFAVPEWVEPVEANEAEGTEAEEGYWKVVNREIDLGKKNRDAFLKALEKYAGASREVQAPVAPSRPVAAASGANPALTEWNRRVKAWLEENRPEYGVKANTKGRVKGEHEAVYLKANPSDPKPA